jgi:peptidoglycan/LPS O-acetylase OafA/YrhL
MRWVSAMLVVIAHTANLMVARLIDTPISLRSPYLYFWTFIAGFGHQAVTIFYILSGFLVGGPLLSVIQREGAIPWRRYFTDRVVRIYLVLIPSLFYCFILDRISYRINPGVVNEFIEYHSAWTVFLGNLLNLQNFFIPFYGSNGPIGTLAIEMWFYISFPLLLAPFCRRYPLSRRISLFIVAIVLNVTLGLAQPTYLLGFLIWGTGVAARNYDSPAFRYPSLTTGFFFASLVGIRVVMRREMSANVADLFISDLFLATALYCVLVMIRQMPEAQQSFFFWKGHKKLAGFSYSVYLLHMPTLFLLTVSSKAAFDFGIQDILFQPSQWLLVLLAVGICFAIAYLFSLLTERHTTFLRDFVLRKASEH